MKKLEKIEWNEEVDKAFEDLKSVLSTPPVLVAPKGKDPLLLYISATNQVVSTIIIVESSEEGKTHGVPHPVYYLSEAKTHESGTVDSYSWVVGHWLSGDQLGLSCY
jgi:hypothetical protein